MTVPIPAPLRRGALLAAALFVLGACATAEKPAASSGPAARITSIPRSFDARQLAGMDSDNVARLLGSPGLLRRDGPAQIWQYVDEDCILDFICEANACVELTGPNCDGNYTVRIPAADDTDCRPYKCDPTECKQTCGSVNDCVDSVCNAAGECVPQLVAPTDLPSCSCRIVGAPSPNRNVPWQLAFAGVALAVLRRRRRQG